MKSYFVYIMASERNGTLYVGLTSDLRRRAYEHKHGLGEGFTKEYNVKKLVYYEVFDDPQNAIRREKRLKEWQRKWKLDLIEGLNPDWRDLYEELNR
jgi:putative endonuclease